MRDYEAEERRAVTREAAYADMPEQPEEPNMHPDMDDLWEWTRQHHPEECCDIIAEYFKTCDGDKFADAIILLDPIIQSSSRWSLDKQIKLQDAQVAFAKFRDKELSEGYPLRAWRAEMHEKYDAAMAEFESDMDSFKASVRSN